MAHEDEAGWHNSIRERWVGKGRSGSSLELWVGFGIMTGEES